MNPFESSGTSRTETSPDEETTQVRTVEKKRRPRGFAAMDPRKVSEIASKGGKAAHAAGTAHQFSSDEARVAGKKGGVAPHVRRGRGPRIDQAQTGEVPIANEASAEDKEQKSA